MRELLKRLNIGLPFMIELSKYFMDYGKKIKD